MLTLIRLWKKISAQLNYQVIWRGCLVGQAVQSEAYKGHSLNRGVCDSLGTRGHRHSEEGARGAAAARWYYCLPLQYSGLRQDKFSSSRLLNFHVSVKQIIPINP